MMLMILHLKDSSPLATDPISTVQEGRRGRAETQAHTRSVRPHQLLNNEGGPDTTLVMRQLTPHLAYSSPQLFTVNLPAARPESERR